MVALWDPLETRVTADEVVLAARKREIQNILKSYVGFFDPFCELIQNSMDAVDARMRLQGTRNYQKRVWICINLRENLFSITDNGIGFEEAQFRTFLAPNISFKPSGQKTRGKKGVGATYLAYGFNYLQLGTKTPSYSQIAELTNGREWVEDKESIVPRPNVADSSLLHDEYGQVDRGSTFTIRFIGDHIRPKDLSWIGATNAEQWAAILSIKTPLGHIPIQGEDNQPIHCVLKVTDRDGNVTEKEFVAQYQFPHDAIKDCANFAEIQEYQQRQIAAGRDPSNLPRKFTGLNGIYKYWSTDELERLLEREPEHQALIRQHGITAYGFFCYSVRIWDKYNDDVVKLRKGARILRGGLQLSTNNMPQGELITIPLSENIGYQNQSLVIVHFRDADPDLGRKGFQPELKELGEAIAVAGVNLLKRRRPLLKKDSGAEPRIVSEGNLHDWIKEQERHEEQNPLSLINDNFFIPVNEMSITARPLSEQDVIVLFNQLIAGGVIRGIRLLATSQHEQYDAIFRYHVKEPLSNHYFDQVANPLGVRELQHSEEYKSRPYVLEYKYSVDGLIRDFNSGLKQERDINLVVAWEMGQEWRTKYQVTSLLDLENIRLRPFHGVTHLFLDDNADTERFYGIILSELIQYLQDIEASQLVQRERYSDDDS